jgi:hypothetical protein
VACARRFQISLDCIKTAAGYKQNLGENRGETDVFSLAVR